ncbi:hypothetical protein K2X33_14495, partial [bacterium]|nr:hypothetical protein [bacterium]
DMFNDIQDPPRVTRGYCTDDVKVYTADEVLGLAMSLPRGELEVVLPRGLNSCASRGLLERIRQSPAGHICPPISPDYTLAFLQLAFTDKLLNILDCLTVYGSCQHSFGRKFIMKQSKDETAPNFAVEQKDIVEHVPLKVVLTTTGMFNDFERIKKKVGGRLNRFSAVPVHFWMECWRDLDLAESLGVPMAEEKALWKATLEQQPQEVQRAVTAQQRRVVSPLETLRGLGRGLGLQGAWHATKRSFGWRPPTDEGGSILPPVFASPEDYVAWETGLLKT